MTWLEYVFLVPALLLFGYAAVSDFATWRIPNWVILALIAVYAVGMAVKTVLAPTNVLSLLESHHAAEGFFDVHAVWSDLGAAGLLFGLGVIFWLVRMFGAGDAKLFFPIGLYVGWIGLLPFAILLVAAGALSAIVLKFPMPLPLQFSFFFMRLDEIRKTQKIPYGVVMTIATFGTIALRLWRGI